MPWYRTTPVVEAIVAVAVLADEGWCETVAEQVSTHEVGIDGIEERLHDAWVFVEADNVGVAGYEFVRSTTHVSLHFPAVTSPKTGCPDCSARSVPL